MKSNSTNIHIPLGRSLWYCIILLSSLFYSQIGNAQCNGGQVLTGASNDNATVCLEEAVSQGLNVYNTGFAPTNYAYAITDVNNQILLISNSSNLKFEGLIEGTYYVFGFSYQGNIEANQGDNVYFSQFASGCWQISSNRMEILLVSPAPSEIRTGDFQTSKFLCLNEGEPDFVSFQNVSERNSPYVFLVTDNQDRIIEVTDKSFTDFTNFPAGDCKIYGLAYTGQLLARYGMQISDNLAMGCFELSNNAIEVNRALVNGGNVFTQDVRTFHEITTDDGQSDQFNLTNTGSVQADYTFIITDASNNLIEHIDASTIDFEGFNPGTYRIWGFSFSGDILINEGQSIFSGNFSEGCFSRSFNAITISATHEGVGPPPCVIGATNIGALTETVLCQDGPITEVITDADMSHGEESALILVDASNSIVQISQASEVEIINVTAGTYEIFQVVFEQLSNLLIGVNIDNLSGCFALSNAIEIEILPSDHPNCGGPNDCLLEASILSSDVETVCIEDLENNSVSFVVENEGAAETGILITDLNGTILELSADRIIEINDIGTNVYYHINYENTVEIFGGVSIEDLEGCFTLSNGISITGIDNCFTTPCDATPSAIFTTNPTSLCATDPNDDMVVVGFSGGVGAMQTFLLVAAGQDEILSSNNNGEFDFSDDEIGNFEIYLLNYNLPFTLGNSIAAFEGCFALSAPIGISNSLDNCIIEPVICENDGGVISYDGPVGLCGSDGQNDIININVELNGGNNRVFLLVDEFGTIISVAPALVILNNPFPSGNYEIYALSYDEFPSGLTTNENLSSFSNLCLSNSIQISISDDFCEGSGVRGGEVSDDFGQSEIKFCTDVVGEIFTVNLETTGSTAFDYTYIETDENNIITRVLDANTIMYTADPTESMTNRVWGVSFTGSFAAFIGEDITSVALSDDAFNLSNNFITVEVTVVIGEDPQIIGVEIPFLEVEAGQAFDLTLVPNMSAFLDYETAYILFDVDAVTVIDVLYPDENFNITLPELAATPLTGELLTLIAVAYTDNILLLPGDQANDAFLPNATNVTDGCFDVPNTSIAISVIEDEGIIPLGGMGGMDLDNSYDVNTEEISLRPNPVRELMEVTFPQSFVDQKVGLNIYSISGELILKMNFDKAPTTELIDVSGFAVGTYTLQAYTNSSARTIQFLKI